MMGGEGPRTIAILWSMTAVVFILLVLRLYTRYFLIRGVGWDDYMYFWSWVFLFLHNFFLHIAANHGFGQDQATLPIDEGVTAHRWEQIGQTFIILGMGMSKMSLAMFLLRIVIVRWHRLSIWGVAGSLMFASVMTAILCWLQCIPVDRIFDSRIEGRCIIQPVPWAILLGSFCIFVDFFFAIFPWIVIKNLEMKRKDKLIVGGCLSFGIIAGICGIVRTANLKGLGSKNYTGDTVHLVVWSAAEMSVTLVCIAVPIIMPLYLRMTGKSSSNGSGVSGRKKSDRGGSGSTSVKLKAIPAHASSSNREALSDQRTGVDGLFHEGPISYLDDGNRSDEAILPMKNPRDRPQKGIMVREEVIVSSTS